MMTRLDDYAGAILLHERIPRPTVLGARQRGEICASLLSSLLAAEGSSAVIPPHEREQRRLLRALCNRRPPGPAPDGFTNALDRLLWTERLEAGIVEAGAIAPIRETHGCQGRHAGSLALWRGDITRLAVDAIVNAANEQLLGCFRPLHSCIDNAIHSAAGIQLREDCARIMRLQGKVEERGGAKITRAYSLPSRYVLHTVGPVVEGSPTDTQRRLLASSYAACLDLADEMKDIDSIAFPCISTGVYGFPGFEAAAVAVEAVSAWLDSHPGRFGRVTFDVFTENDHERYERILTR
jgi:O-acetyl-ADP-ribose deacetylase (regulator of RNase III)